jgi:hypothetical protein
MHNGGAKRSPYNERSLPWQSGAGYAESASAICCRRANQQAGNYKCGVLFNIHTLFSAQRQEIDEAIAWLRRCRRAQRGGNN